MPDLPHSGAGPTRRSWWRWFNGLTIECAGTGEYGNPAVPGTGVATKRIHSGQMITVDGSAGVVVLSHEISSNRGVTGRQQACQGNLSRTALEASTLQAELAGRTEYAAKARYGLAPSQG